MIPEKEVPLERRYLNVRIDLKGDVSVCGVDRDGGGGGGDGR